MTRSTKAQGHLEEARKMTHSTQRSLQFRVSSLEFKTQDPEAETRDS